MAERAGERRRAQAIFKCVDDAGHVSYQEQVCAAAAASEQINVPDDRRSLHSEAPPGEAPPGGAPPGGAPPGVIPHYVPLEGLGTLVIISFEWWNFSVTAGVPTTVAMRSKSGEEPLSLQMTFLPDRRDRVPTEDDEVASFKQFAARYAEGSVEQAVFVRGLDTTIGTAYMANFNEAKYQGRNPPPGEFSSITVGQIMHPSMAVSITVLTNNADSSAHDDALQVISSFAVVGEDGQTY